MPIGFQLHSYLCYLRYSVIIHPTPSRFSLNMDMKNAIDGLSIYDVGAKVQMLDDKALAFNETSKVSISLSGDFPLCPAKQSFLRSTTGKRDLGTEKHLLSCQINLAIHF